MIDTTHITLFSVMKTLREDIISTYEGRYVNPTDVTLGRRWSFSGKDVRESILELVKELTGAYEFTHEVTYCIRKLHYCIINKNIDDYKELLGLLIESLDNINLELTY